MHLKRSRRGQSLLEVIAASTIIAAALVPALRMMRDSLEVSRSVEEADLMSTLCVDKLEEHLNKVAATWDKTTASGDYAALEGRSYLQFQVTKSDAVPDGGISDRLMAITAVVWNDANGNGGLDGGEKKVTFATKVSKSVSYKNEAQGL
jgi:type II secretory pathway component PulJ